MQHKEIHKCNKTPRHCFFFLPLLSQSEKLGPGGGRNPRHSGRCLANGWLPTCLAFVGRESPALGFRRAASAA